MATTKLYTAIYVLLFVLATVQVAVEQYEIMSYWAAFSVIAVLSFVKAGFVAAYYMHLRSEPRSVTYVIVTGLAAALALAVAASYSIL